MHRKRGLILRRRWRSLWLLNYFLTQLLSTNPSEVVLILETVMMQYTSHVANVCSLIGVLTPVRKLSLALVLIYIVRSESSVLGVCRETCRGWRNSRTYYSSVNELIIGGVASLLLALSAHLVSDLIVTIGESAFDLVLMKGKVRLVSLMGTYLKDLPIESRAWVEQELCPLLEAA